jgi:hypothetical protein
MGPQGSADQQRLRDRRDPIDPERVLLGTRVEAVVGFQRAVVRGSAGQLVVSTSTWYGATATRSAIARCATVTASWIAVVVAPDHSALRSRAYAVSSAATHPGSHRGAPAMVRVARHTPI